MRTIESIKENEVIHCPTEQQAIAFCKLAFGKDYSIWVNNWYRYLNDTCYTVEPKGFSPKRYFEENRRKITDVSEFLPKPEAPSIFDLQETQKQIEHTQKILADLVEIQSRIDQDHYLKGQKIALTDK